MCRIQADSTFFDFCEPLRPISITHDSGIGGKLRQHVICAKPIGGPGFCRGMLITYRGRFIIALFGRRMLDNLAPRIVRMRSDSVNGDDAMLRKNSGGSGDQGRAYSTVSAISSGGVWGSRSTLRPVSSSVTGRTLSLLVSTHLIHLSDRQYSPCFAHAHLKVSPFRGVLRRVDQAGFTEVRNSSLIGYGIPASQRSLTDLFGHFTPIV